MNASVQPTLILDASTANGQQLAEQLGHAGFASDAASTSLAAKAAARDKHYGAMIVIGDLRDSGTLSCISDLRTQAPGAWLIVVALAPPGSARELTWPHGVDALLTLPYSVQNLASRLSAFAQRSRPS